MSDDRYYVVGFEPDRIFSIHKTYTDALIRWEERGSLLSEAVRTSGDPRWRYAGQVGATAPGGFLWARPTPDEIADWKTRYHGTSPRQKRLVCTYCGTRIWGSGLGIGSHNRACKAPFLKRKGAAA